MAAAGIASRGNRTGYHSQMICVKCSSEFDDSLTREGLPKKKPGAPRKYCSFKCKQSSKKYADQPYVGFCTWCSSRFEIHEPVRGRPTSFCSPECRSLSAKAHSNARYKPRQADAPRGRPPRSVDAEEVVNLHRNGMTIAALSRQFRVKGDRIKSILEEQGVEIVSGAWGKNHQRWKGGRFVETKTGYVKVTLGRTDPLRTQADKTGQMYEHRYVMSLHLGRLLESWEEVHHKDGNRENNNIKNLQLRSTKHGPGVVFRCLDCGSHNVQAEEL